MTKKILTWKLWDPPKNLTCGSLSPNHAGNPPCRHMASLIPIGGCRTSNDSPSSDIPHQTLTAGWKKRHGSTSPANPYRDPRTPSPEVYLWPMIQLPRMCLLGALSQFVESISIQSQESYSDNAFDQVSWIIIRLQYKTCLTWHSQIFSGRLVYPTYWES